MEQIIRHAVAALLQGETLLYPTDTIWGLGCDARLAEAVERLYALKERNPRKSMLVLSVPEIIDSEQFSSLSVLSAFDDSARPTTYILPAERWQGLFDMELAANLIADDGSLGVRMVRGGFCHDLICRLGAPIVSTSANLSGQPSPTTYADISPEVLRRVGHCIPPLPQFESGQNRSSRIIKIYPDGSSEVLRS